jgi:hypothetical protein
MIHRKPPEDLVGYLSVLYHKLAGNRKSGCVEMHEVSWRPVSAFPDPPAIPMDLEMSPLPAFLNSAPPPLMAAVAASTAPVAELAVTPRPAVTPKPVAETRRARRTYHVAVDVPRETAMANGIVPGTFPSLFLENQKKDGEWGKRHKMVTTVSESASGYSCRIVLPRPPAANSAVAIDFENGNSLVITSDLLSKGAVSEVAVPSTKKKKAYVALSAAYPVRQGFLLMLFRFAAPTAIHAGAGFAFGGPIGLATAPASLAASFATRKIDGNRRAMAVEQHPSLHTEYLLANQGERMEKLEREIELLKQQLISLRQTETNPNSTSRRESK